MAGTKVGSKIIETAKRVGSAAKSVVSRVANGARNVFNKVFCVVVNYGVIL